MKSEIIFPVPELKIALSGLNKLVGKRTTLPVLSHVRVTRKPNGLVTLQGTDLDAFATFTLNHTQAGEVVDVLVPLEQLNKAFKCSTSKQDVALVCEGKTTKLRYCIGGTPVNQPVNTLPIGEWPILPPISTESTRLQPGFGEALKQAMACCSEDPGRQVLRGACLNARDKKAHYVVGTNGRMLYSANSFNFPLKEAVIIPDSKFITGSGLLDEECRIAIQPGKKPSDIKQVCLHNMQWEFITRAIEGQYPNWKQCVPSVDAKWTKLKLQPSAIEQLLQVIPNLPGNDTQDKVVRLRIERMLWVEGRNKDDADWTRIAVPDVVVSGKSQIINLNRDYLVNALKFGLDEWFIFDELTPLAASKDGKKIVVMPVRPPVQTAATKPTPSAPPPPQAEVKPVAEERKTEMPKEIKPEAPKPADQPSLLEQVEQIKDTLKNAIRDLNGLTDVVKQTEKDRRTTEKEVEAARHVLKKLQHVSL